jgi:hypothetical protein
MKDDFYPEFGVGIDSTSGNYERRINNSSNEKKNRVNNGYDK